MEKGMSDVRMEKLDILIKQQLILEEKLKEIEDPGGIKKIKYDLSQTKKGINRVMGRDSIKV